MEIRELSEEYRGMEFSVRYTSEGYYDIQPTENGFSFAYTRFPQPTECGFKDTLLSEWLEHPKAFGVFEGDDWLGFAEGSLEEWNNRYRISNIFVFDAANRRRGVGGKLMRRMLEEARSCGARMAVLETQTCNEAAIAFYRSFGFEVIGFDRYAYSNDDPQRHEMRLEMGVKLDTF